MAAKTKQADPLKQFNDIEKMIGTRLKQVKPLLDKANGMLSQLPNYTPIQMKDVWPMGSDGPRAKASLTAGGAVLITFPSKEEALFFYNNLK
jgi:hypothetical protein